MGTWLGRDDWRCSDTVREKVGGSNRLDQRKLGLHFGVGIGIR